MKSRILGMVSAVALAIPLALASAVPSLAQPLPASTAVSGLGLSCPEGATSLDDCDSDTSFGPAGAMWFYNDVGDVYVEWNDNALIMPSSFSCSTYYFSYGNFTGLNFSKLEVRLLDPWGGTIDWDTRFGVANGVQGEFQMFICSSMFSNGSGPYTLRFSIADSSSNTDKIETSVFFMPRGGHFRDDDRNTHEGNIEAIRRAGLTYGCNPPKQDLYCPKDSVTRGQMAAFLRRALDLPIPTRDYFKDDNSSTFQKDINAIRAAGITFGCNPPKNDRFCPNDVVTREQMAAFLVRAFGYPNAKVDYFKDDNRSTLQASINALAQAGVTYGCNPPSNTNFCPKDSVKRDQMASFFARALDLKKLPVPPRA